MSNLVGPSSLIQSDFSSDGHGNLEAVLFRDGQLHHLFGVGKDHGIEWSVAQTIPSPASGSGSIIQSDFGGGDHKNFEVVLWNRNQLVHWWHDKSDVNLPWQSGQIISTEATGPGCIIQSNFAGGDHGNFEVVVLEGNNLVPCDGVSVGRSASGPAWIIQSNFGSHDHGNFEVVVLEGNNLVHWWHDNSDVNNGWRRGQIITSLATGPGRIIQSNFGSSEHGNFEVVVLEGTNLVHYFHDNSDVNLPWQRGQTISTRATGPGCIIQSNFGDRERGNFEVVVLEGHSLVHYFHDNSDVNLPWQRGQTISGNATGAGCIIQSNFGSSDHGNFEVVVPEGSTLVHYFHDNSDVNLPWQRAQTIAFNVSGPGCIIQSDFGDRAHGNFEVVVLQGNNLAHWWHDNSDVNLPWRPGQIISTVASGPGCIIQSNFSGGGHGNFEVVVPEGNRIAHWWHDNSDVSLPWQRGQLVTRASMYVFFTTDRIEDPGTDWNSMGRSVLARSEDNGINFGPPLFDFSTNKFINSSMQVVNHADFPDLPQGEGDALLLWGSGGYRRSNVYLAYVPLVLIEDRAAYRYFTGIDAATGTPRWGNDEGVAQPLFLSGSVGELCVRWNPFLKRFILLYNSDNPGFILERQSRLPWGPWSPCQNIFDIDHALGVYMHKKDSNDGLSDPGQEGEGGGAYGPYLISRYTTPQADGSTKMYFVLSVHNPYNTMLMSAVVRAR
ncbi:MAG: DUF4185 domain-containing protein [Acidobacteriia bacterium]|nr:DUF4185 domain-containing protein [Terriglobia bacterium]